METKVMEAHDALSVLSAEDADTRTDEVPVATPPEAVAEANKQRVANSRAKRVIR